jgi:CHAD domain-containing protein
MERHREVERKYQVPDDFTLPDLTTSDAVASVDEPIVHDLSATYFDTQGLRLTDHRVTLRRRTGGTDAGWHLKLPANAGARTELRMPLGRDADEVPAEIVSLVRAMSRGERLRPVARIRTRRLERAMRDEAGAPLALLCEDEVRGETLDDAPTHRRWRELEVELVDGEPGVLDEVEAVLRAAGVRPAAAPSKLARVLEDRLSPNGKRPERPPTTARGALGAYVRAQRDAIIRNDLGVRRDEPEAVHDLRVATRRLRSTLRTFRSVFDRTRTDPLRDELRWLANVLASVRDGEVMAERLTEAIAAEPPELVIGPVEARIRQRLAIATAAGSRLAIDALNSSRYLRLLERLDELVAVPFGTDLTHGRLRRMARKAIERADMALDEAEDRDEGLHEARKRYKAARYAVEVLRPLYSEPARRLASRLTDLQDALGTHQDTIVTSELLREYAIDAHEAGESTFTYGLLDGRQHEAGMDALRELPRARRRAGRRRARHWLRG